MNGTSSSSSSTSFVGQLERSTTGTQSPADLQNTFLTLLVTQLQNQDPTNPTDSSQMTSQLAQISTVSGIGQLNTSLSSLATQLSAGQSAQAAMLIGATVLAPGSTITVSERQGQQLRRAVANALSDMTVSVTNSAGQVVNTIDSGAQAAGTVPISGWTPTDATGATLPDGTYTITAAGTVNGLRSRRPRCPPRKCRAWCSRPTARGRRCSSTGKTVPLTSIASIL